MPKLTKRVVDATPFPLTGQRFVRDTDLAGFALRVTKGSKTFVLEKRMHGRVRRLTLGPYGPLTVEQARATALTLAGDIVQGGDPAHARQAQQGELTFGELADLYLERHAVRKRSAHNDVSALKRHLYGWRGRRLSDISRNDVAKLARTQRILGTRTETETIHRALDLVAEEGALILALRNFVLKGGGHIEDIDARR